MRAAFHVPSHVPDYDTLSQDVFDMYSWTRYGSGFITDTLKKNGYKMLHIIGNTGLTTSLVGIRKWIKSLGWKKTEDQRPWMFNNGEEFVGYIHTWDNYQVATIQGDGHKAIFGKTNETMHLVIDFVTKLKI